MNVHTQSLVLSELFLVKVKRFKKDSKGRYPGTDSYKLSLIKNAYDCLKSGNSFTYMKEFFAKSTPEDSRFYNIYDYLADKDSTIRISKIERKKNELISLGSFYYHPLLQETNPAPTYTLDSQTMELKKSEREPFYLEIKESFTAEELLSYYYSSHGKSPLPGSSGLTQILNLVSGFGLDLSLYMIEASSRNISDGGKGSTTPAFLPEFLEEATRIYENRIQISKEGGLTRVYPRSQN